jgi:hypothetical protein
MKNVFTRALALIVIVMLVSFTQPAAALPRYSYGDFYYAADQYNVQGPATMYCRTYETGHDTLACDGHRDRDGILEGRFRHSYQYECSTNTVIFDDWYVYSESCGYGYWKLASSNSCYVDTCYQIY